jgi:hypothetical protein
MNKSCAVFLLFLSGAASMFMINNDAFSRTEEVVDTSNNNLVISLNAPDDWSSGKLSMTVVSLDWRLSGVFATNFATKLFGPPNQSIAFFATLNTPSLVSFALPFAEKIGLISLALSKYVTITGESEMTLSDGTSAHVYNISVSTDQLRKLQAPLDKPLDAVLITTKQYGKPYIVLYATEQGKMGQYQSTFDKMLNSVTIGTVSFLNPASPITPVPQIERDKVEDTKNSENRTVSMLNATTDGNMTLTK